MNWYNPTEGTWVVSGEFATSSILAGSGVWIEDAKGSGNLLITYTASGAKVFSSGVLQFSTMMAPAGVVTLSNKGTLGSVKYHPRAFTDAEAIALATGDITVSFTLRNVFNNSPQGVWYDPSDLSTLFQDAGGTIPVTAAGQPVGLMLDKSKGLVLGPEKFLYGDGSATGWTHPGVNGGSVSSSGGELVLTSGNPLTAVTDRLCYAPLSGLTAGAWYKVTGGLRSISDASGAKLSIASSATAGDTSGTFVSTSSAALTPVALSFQATAATMYVRLIANNGTGSAQVSCDNISVRKLPGNHATQPTASKRPILQESGGLYSLKFDGVDDFMSTAAIDFSGTDKLSIWAGVTKLNDTARIIAELSATATGNSGSFFLASGTDAGYSQAYTSIARGTAAAIAGQIAGYVGVPAPDTAALTITHDISGSLSTIKRNGVAGVNGTFNKGAGNFGNYPLYIASRAGTSMFFNGNLYPLVIAGALYDADTVAKMDAWTAKKTGVTI